MPPPLILLSTRRRLRAEAGSATVMVLVFPLVLLMILLVVQFALAFHGKSVLTGAAQDGARAAQLSDGDVSVGRAEAAEVVADNADGLVEGVAIDVTSNGDVVTARVTGVVVDIVPIPGLDLRVGGTASGPVERFRPEGGSR